MNQRSKRARDRRRADQNVDMSTMHTGGHVTSYGRGKDPDVRTPQKTTGDASNQDLSGIAKASPFFKPIEEVLPPDEEDEKRAIAESTEEVLDEEEVEQSEDD